MAAVQVGPFRLERCIGKGGMGEVWLGRHRAGVPAALKFDLQPPDPERREDFLHEVRLVAGLNHPNCVLVFDAGIVGPGDASEEGGPVREGAPWLAMEVATGGSVAERPPADWEETLHVFRGLFLALAHAHARGVVHRDIKPGNLLLAGPRGDDASAPTNLLDARVVLSDFGIGVQVDRPGTLDRESVGTPRYMAPEQIEAQWRDQGPWTDVYQAGIMLWRLTCGTFPFPHSQTAQLYWAHLYEKPGAFVPQFDVPSGLEAFCRSLIGKKPAERPQFAADALRRLEALGAVSSGSGARRVAGAVADQPTVLRDGRTPSRLPTHRPPPRDGGALDMRLRGAGLGLWGLRPVPMVGREAPRAAGWEALLEVKRSRRPGVLVISGPEGSGKSRLASWLVEQAHEAGEATHWRARHTAGADSEQGLDGMLRTELRLQGLDREEATARLGRYGTAADLLVRWLVDRDKSGLSDAHRFVLAEQVLADTDRPRVVWVDDAQWGAEALRFVLHACDKLQHPVLFVLAVRDEDLAEDTGVPPLLKRVSMSPRTRAIELGPLDEVQHRELVRGMLGLDGLLALEVERRTAGNPRFAVELVDSFIEQGVLVPGPKGLVLRDGATPTLPADLVAVWADRVERLAEDHDDEELAAFELAARLGMEFTVEEWRRACRLALLPPAPGLLEGLVAARLLRTDDGRRRLWFAHPLLREHLLERSRLGGRDQAHVAACAEALRDLPASDERRGTLLFEAGRLAEAFHPLWLGVDAQLARGEHRDSRLLKMLEAIPFRLGLPADDPRWGSVWLMRAWQLRNRGQKVEADELVARTEAAAQRHGWKNQLAMALREAGRVAAEFGELRDGLDMLTRAEQLLREIGKDMSAASCRTLMGGVHQKLGQLERAEELYRSTLGAFDDPLGARSAVIPLMALAQIHQRRGQLDEATVWLRRALDTAARLGQQKAMGEAANQAGEIARARGDLVAAEASYHEAVRCYEVLRDEEGRIPILNLGLVRVLLGRYEEARAIVAPLLAELRENDGDPVMVAFCASVLLPADAGVVDLEAFDEHWQALQLVLASTGLADPDIERLCTIAADLAPDPRRSSRARALAVEQAKRLRPAS